MVAFVTIGGIARYAGLFRQHYRITVARLAILAKIIVRLVVVALTMVVGDSALGSLL
jgi:hypothetical protein